MSHENESDNPLNNTAPFQIEVADRVKRLPPYLFARINAVKYQKRRAGDDVIDLGMGNPSDPPQDLVIEKLAEAARDIGNHGYSKATGIPNLRREVASKYLKKYGVRLDPESEVIVCLGSKEGFSHMCLALVGPGDTAIVPAPYFPVHVYAVALAAANVIALEVADSDKFLSNIAYTCQHLYPKPKLLIVNYPHNPSAVTVEREFFTDIVKLARRYGFMVISDFAYADVAFEGYQPPSFLSAPGAKEVGVEFTTMSKGYNMAGWRVGFCAGNPEMVRALGTIKTYYDYGMFEPIQVAAIMALRHTDAAVEAQSVLYQRRRDVLVRRSAPHRLGNHSAQSRHVRLGQDSRALGQPHGHHAVCHQAPGRGRRGGQPGQWVWPRGRRLSAAGLGRERKPIAAGRAADRPLLEF